MTEKSWCAKKMEDPEFRAGVEAERAKEQRDTIPLSEKLDALMRQYPEIVKWGRSRSRCGVFITLRTREAGFWSVFGFSPILDEAAEQATRRAMALINEMRGNDPQP